MKKRKVELVVISDVHLGTFGCHAKELLLYLNSIDPRRLILNGDIIDIWQFRKRYFPKSHLEVIKKIIDLSANGTEVIYITGNHDDILINRFLNWWLLKMKKEKFSLSKKIKNGVKKAVKHINDFEQIASDLAIEKNYKYVVCGHIHQPQIVRKVNRNGTCLYLNSGDWVENLTSLEYNQKRWKLYQFHKDDYDTINTSEVEKNIHKEFQDVLAAITIISNKISN